MTQVKAGTWVEIEKILLTPEQRAPTLPEDTKQVPYVLNVSGFLLEDAELGSPARIRTLIGRELEGTLKTVNPSYAHSFGEVVPELLTIGLEEEA
ncbi:MAG: 2-amino-4-ketopentanoate thiolase [Brevefilum sp.]|nr:2-amino-4-ketopentanoate thiolase [Brevefilum sp.]